MGISPSYVVFPSGNLSPSPVGGDLPSWVAAQAPGQWFEIPNSAPNAVMPNHSIIDSWNSMVVDPRDSKIYSVAAGGHSDWAGNGAYVFDAQREVPVWREDRASTHNGTESCVAYYASGDPTARHTYYGIHMNTFDNRVMLVGGSWFCSNGIPILSTMDSYNILSKTYNPAGTHPDQPADMQHPDATYCLDPATGDIYAKYNFGTWGRWNRSSNTWTADLAETGTAPDAEAAAMSACDTTRNRIYVQGNGNGLSQCHHVYTIGTNAWTTITVTGARAADITTAGQGSMQYVAAIDAFLIRLSPAGNDVIKVDASTFAATTFPGLSGGTAIQNNSPYTSPANSGAGPYSKFLYAPNLKGCILVQGFDKNCYYLRVH